METILNKLSSYLLLNHILAGGVYCVLSNAWGLPNIPLSENALTNLITFYFIGLTINRFGGIVIEKILLKLKIIKYKPYKEFLYAEQKDKRISELSEASHIYKTFTALMFVITLLLIFQTLYENVNIDDCWNVLQFIISLLSYNIKLIFAFGLFVLFLLSYRKQTKYIISRIEKAKEGKNEHS